MISSSCVPTGQHRAWQAGSCRACHGMGPGHRWVGAEGVTTPCGCSGPAPHAAAWRRAVSPGRGWEAWPDTRLIPLGLIYWVSVLF